MFVAFIVVDESAPSFRALSEVSGRDLRLSGSECALSRPTISWGSHLLKTELDKSPGLAMALQGPSRLASKLPSEKPTSEGFRR